MSAVVNSVWRVTVEGRNWFGQHGAFMGLHEVNNMVGGDQDAFLLLVFLRAHQGRRAIFWIANGLSKHPVFPPLASGSGIASLRFVPARHADKTNGK